MKLSNRYLLAFVTGLATVGAVEASNAGFKLSAVGIDLGKPDDENAEIPKYKVKVKVGQTVTLVAEGVVFPRGGAAGPGDIDAGALLFDDAGFKLVPPEKVKSDKTKQVVALTALKPGPYRVRFVGDILGRYHKFDVMVEVVEK
jgi:hypothetical protein